MNQYRGCSISAAVLAWCPQWVVIIVCAWKWCCGHSLKCNLEWIWAAQPNKLSTPLSLSTNRCQFFFETSYHTMEHGLTWEVRRWTLFASFARGVFDQGAHPAFFHCFLLRFPICKVTLFNLPWPITNASHLCEVQPGACIGPGSSWLVAGGPNDTQCVSGTAPDLWVAEAFC